MLRNFRHQPLVWRCLSSNSSLMLSSTTSHQLLIEILNKPLRRCQRAPERQLRLFSRETKTRHSVCSKCHGEGIQLQVEKLSRHKLKRPQKQQEKDGVEDCFLRQLDHVLSLSRRPHFAMQTCSFCHGTGLVEIGGNTQIDSSGIFKEHDIHVSIIGGGIGGCALTLALRQRNIPCTLFEKDENALVRSQGYGLTLQQVCLKLLTQ